MNIEEQYLDLLRDILENGVKKCDRTGTGTISVFGRQISHKMSDGFPLLTTKKMAWKSIVTELIWFLRGETNIKYLLENNCHIWTGDAYKNYRKKVNSHYISGGDVADEKEFEEMILKDENFAAEFGELGPIYGKQWRNWKFIDIFTNGENTIYANGAVDQISNLISELKSNPDSRRLMVSAWNVGELNRMVLPPCHYGFQLYTRELSERERYDLVRVNGLCPKYSFEIEDGKPVANKLSEKEWYDKHNIPTRAISLMWNQRSCDFPLGIPYNIASYAVLLSMIAKNVNMIPDELIGNLGDCHIYLNQIDGVKEQISRTPLKFPELLISDISVNDISEYSLDDIKLENYSSHPTIKFPLSN